MSNDTKYLDLDALSVIDSRVITLDGVKHPMQETSVKDFIAINKKIADLEKAEKAGQAVGEETSIDLMIETISLAFPTIGKERLGQLAMGRLSAIISFMQGEMDKEVVNAQETAPVSVEAGDEKKD